MRVLYMVDNFTACGGAHVATKKLIRKHLEEGDCVGVVHLDHIANCIKKEYKDVEFYHFPLVRYSFRWFLQRVIYKWFNSAVYPCFLIDPWGKIRRIMRSYDVVCVPSEESILRPLLLGVGKSVKKIVLIHMNYDLWLEKNETAYKHAWCDQALFHAVDKIGVVGAIGANQLKKRYPQYAPKIYPFYNLIDVYNGFRESVYQRDNYGEGCIRLISLVRIQDKAGKDCDRMIRVARILKSANISFIWDVYGGDEVSVNQYRIIASDVADVFRLHGHQQDATEKIKFSDLMVLLSHCEGLPNVIYESLISGTPVFSTNVAGIPEQIIDGKTGWLVDDDEFQIVHRLKNVLSNKQCICKCHKNLENYTYDNERVWNEYVKFFFDR